MEQIHSKVVKTGDRIFYSLAQKQSQRKIMFNERLLILVDQKYLGYIQEYNKKDLDASCDLGKIKKKIPLKDIRRILNINKQITLMINQYDKSNKLRSIKWLFRFNTQQLANSWTQLLERQNSPFPSRKTTQQKQKQHEHSNDKSHTKNPSIKDLINQAQIISKQRQDDNKTNKRSLIDSKQQKIKSSGSKNVDLRESDISKRTFSFRGPGQDDQDGSNNSPPRMQSKIIQPSPILQKFKKVQQNLGKHLQDAVDLKLVQKQLNHIKQQSKKYQRGEFRQLGQSLTNRQKQIANANFVNYFKQKVQQINDKKFQQFYVFCEIKIQQLLLQDFDDQLSTKNWISYISNKNGVAVQILPTDLKQIPGNSNICDQGLLKSYLNRIKNADYLWKIISKDEQLSQVFKMPMSCMVEYQGILAYFTCNFIVQNQSIMSVKNQDFSKCFDKLADMAKINRITFQNPNCIKFVKISSQQFVISSISQFLPRLTFINSIVRPQIYPQIAQQFPSSQPNYIAKIGKKQQQQQNRYFKQPIQQAVQILSKNLDKLQQYVIHPSQFSKLLHVYGLNIILLSQIQRRVQNTFMKNILKTQAAIRSFKVIYRKKMQQLLLTIKEGQADKTQSRNMASLQKMTKSLLNVLLSKTEQSNLLWDVVTLHSQINFKMPVNKHELNKGYLYLGLQHHLGIKMDSKYSNCQKIFTTDDGFINDLYFIPKLKPSQLYWLDEQVYHQSLSEAAQSLIKQFDLKQKQIPFYIYQNKNILQKIFQIISMYYGPGSANIKHLKMYDDPDSSNFDLTLHYYRRKVTQIKWLIKAQSQIVNRITISRIQQKLQRIKQSLQFYFGNFHPFYTQIYDILISLYERQKNYQKVQQLFKLSMSNIIQLCGGNTMHLRLANNYYQKGQFYQNWNKIQQSIDSYKKAKNILQFNQYTNARQYAMIQLKLSILYLSKYKDGDCYKLLGSCLITFCKLAKIPINRNKNRKYMKGTSNAVSQIQDQVNQVSDQQQIQNYNNVVMCLELINRCSISDIPDRISTIIDTSLTVLSKCISPEYPMRSVCLPDDHTVRLLKLVVENYFDQYNKQINKQLIQCVEYICDENQAGNSRFSDPSNSLTVLKQLIVNNIFLETLDDFSNKALMWNQQKGINPLIKKNSINRQTDNFNNLMRALIIVLGEGFILGLLKDKKL